jgi:calcineurin-like phosphoesterase family protein
MSTNVWFTSDTHYGHKNIIKYCSRPFKDAQEMDEILIQNWNQVVKPGDVVYHLGDFTLNDLPIARDYRSRLAGNIHLVYGNHDKWVKKLNTLKTHPIGVDVAGFQWLGPYKEIKVGDQKIILCHYAMEVWNRSHHGSWMLHGHSHGTLRKDRTKRRMDVGVDPNNYRPLSFDEIKAYMDTVRWVPPDYHGAD